MNQIAEQIVEAFGGTTALASALEAPVSTVHSWRKIGIPKARMAHIRLVAKAKGIVLPEREAA